MALGRPKVALILTEDERVLDSLAQLAHGSAPGAARSDHPRVCRGRDQHGGREATADVANDGLQVARAVRARTLDGLYDEPRPGAPRTISGDAIERVIVRTGSTRKGEAVQLSEIRVILKDAGQRAATSESIRGLLEESHPENDWAIEET